MTTVEILDTKTSKERQEEIMGDTRLCRVLAYDARALLGDRGWSKVKSWLQNGGTLDLLTIAPGGLAERMEVGAAGRKDAAYTLSDSRARQAQRIQELASEGLDDHLHCRMFDHIPSVSLSLHYKSEELLPFRGFVGIVTPDPSRGSKDKRWLDLKFPEHKDDLLLYAEQYESLWKRALIPRRRTVFLSYSHADRQVADHVEALLRRHGIDVFRDTGHQRAGAISIDGLLEKQLDMCGAFVILWSPAWESSMWCRAEVNHVLHKDESIRPVIDILRVGEGCGPAPDVRLLNHLYRDAVDRISRELAVEALTSGTRLWLNAL